MLALSEHPPQKPHIEIGIITPPSGAYETEAEAVKAMRKTAPSMVLMQFTLNQQQKKAAGDLALVASAAKAAASAMSNIAPGQLSENNWFGFSKFPELPKLPHH